MVTFFVLGLHDLTSFAMRLLPRCFLFALLILAALGQTRPNAVTPTARENSSQSLKLFLDEILSAAKSGDQAKAMELIKQTEIPDYESWFKKEYPPDKAASWIEPYGKNLEENERFLADKFTDLGGRPGAIGTRKLEQKNQTDRGLEWGMLHSARDPLDIYYAGWVTDEGGKPHTEPIGYFIYIDGMFRWDSLIRFIQPVQIQHTTPDSTTTGNEAELNRNFTGHVFHVGNGVSPPMPLRSPDPDYKTLTKHQRQGLVVLSVVVDVDGIAKNIKVTRSLDSELDEKAVEAVKQWRFKPSQKKGLPVPVEINIEVNFNTR